MAVKDVTRSSRSRHDASSVPSVRRFLRASLCAANSRWARRHDSDQSFASRDHLPAKNALRSASRYAPFRLSEKVRSKRRVQALWISAAWRLGSSGLNAPSRSPLSVCWLKLITVIGWPTSDASVCTMVVLPVPVSPTSRAGSA